MIRNKLSIIHILPFCGNVKQQPFVLASTDTTSKTFFSHACCSPNSSACSCWAEMNTTSYPLWLCVGEDWASIRLILSWHDLWSLPNKPRARVMLWDRHVDIRLRLGPGVSRVQEWGRGEGGTATHLFQGMTEGLLPHERMSVHIIM